MKMEKKSERSKYFQRNARKFSRDLAFWESHASKKQTNKQKPQKTKTQNQTNEQKTNAAILDEKVREEEMEEGCQTSYKTDEE